MMTPSNYPGLSTFIEVVIGISVIIGFIVIFQAMYTAVMERTREIGILKSMGASKFYIVNVILRETCCWPSAGLWWESFQSGGAGRNQVPPADAAGGCDRWMDPAVDDHRHRRGDPGGAISGVQGGAEGSD